MAIKSFGKSDSEISEFIDNYNSSVPVDIVPDSNGTRSLGDSNNRFTNLYANDIYGTVRYADLVFQEKRCAKCNEKFEEGDSVSLTVNKVVDNGSEDDGTYLLPVHQSCT